MTMSHSVATTVHHWRSSTTVRLDGPHVEHLKTSLESLASEAAILRDEEHVGPVGGVAAVPFISYDPGTNVLATQYIDGDSLFNFLWNGTARLRLRATRPEPGTLIRAVGQWLFEFHRRGQRRNVDKASVADCQSQLLRSIERKIESLTTGPFRGAIDASFAARVETRARLLAESPGWDSLEIGPIHGDFVPTNILVTRNGTVFVIDFADTRVGFHLEDVVRFWTVLWELAHCGHRRAAIFSPLLPEILSLNHWSAGVQHSAPFQLLRLWNALTKVLQDRVLDARMPWSTRRLLRRLGTPERAWLEQQCGGPLKE